MKKFLLALAAALVFCVPAFADNEIYFSASQFSYTDYYYDGYCQESDSSQPVYFYAIDDGTVRAISEIQNAPFQCGRVNKGTGGTPNYTSQTCNGTIGDYFGTDCFTIQREIESSSPAITVFPIGTTNAEIGAAFTDFLANQPTPAPDGSPVTVHVPYGNVLYIRVDQRQENIQLVAHMPKLSFLIPYRNYGYWGETGICWGDYNTLPYSGLTFPLQGMSGIDWQRDTSRNVLGQTKTGVATKIMNTGVWYALFCPSLFGHFDLDSSSALPGASVDVTGVFSDIRLYPLSDSYSFVDNEVINGSDSEFQDYLEGEPTESGTVTWTDQDGNVSVPRAGGSSYVPEAETAESLVSQIKNILGNIVRELQTLFTFGYDAIQTLVNLMSDFVSGFSQLYTWLPSPVYSALIAAITVAIVIGVFKVFL